MIVSYTAAANSGIVVLSPLNLFLTSTSTVGTSGNAKVEVKNRFSGQSTTMPEFAAAVYDAIIGSEMFGDYDTVRKGLEWFKQHFAKQYMVVLD